MFHQGHLNILRAARERCDRLVVGVTSDEALIRMKGRAPVIPLKERCDLVSSLRFVDAVVVDLDQDKRLAWRLQPFDVLFKGDDWKDTPKGAALEAEMAEVGARVVYLPYTPSTSSTKLRRFIAPEDFSDLLTEALDAVLGRLLVDLDRRPGTPRLVVPLSGGLDSRLLVAWLALHDALDRTVAFTYGRPGAREVEISRKVAQAVGLEWHAVDYDPAVLRDAWQTQEAADFLKDGYALGALPHVQDWWALRTLLARGTVRPGDIVLPGHTIVGNMHDEHLLDGPPATRSQVAKAIITHHQGLQGEQNQAWADPSQTGKVKEFLALRPFTGSPRDVQSILESYNVRERQTKYINNSVRAYEHLGLEWALPMLDVEFWDAWHRGAVELTATRDFYAVFIGRLWAQATARASGQEQTSQADLAYFTPTQVNETTRSRLKAVLSRLHLLHLAERTASSWATLHSPMSFDAFITDTSRPAAAVQLMTGRTLLGFWARAFITDTWCRRCRLFTDLPVADVPPTAAESSGQKA